MALSKTELKQGFKCFSEDRSDVSMSAGCGKKLVETELEMRGDERQSEGPSPDRVGQVTMTAGAF